MKTLLFILLAFMIVNSSSCTSQKVKFVCGLSETSQIGINHLQPLVDVMERYKIDYGTYPTPNTKDLIPKYIDKIPILNCSGSVAGILPIHNVLENEKLCEAQNTFAEDGSYFSIKFFVSDDRICLTGGKNNYCEYTSDTKKWSCY
jgi:hypothetical protein